jgi:hypothetical protein
MGRYFNTTPEIDTLLKKRNYPAQIWEKYLLANWNQKFGEEERNTQVLEQLQFEEELIRAYEGYTPEMHSGIAMHLGDNGVLFGQGSLIVDVPDIREKDIKKLCTGISKKVAEVLKSQRERPIELFAVLSGLDYLELEKYPPSLLSHLSRTMREAIADPNYDHRAIGYFECRNENESPSWWFPPRQSEGVRLLFKHKS